MTFIAALRCDHISVPWVIDGPINGELFTFYVEKEVAPILAQGDVVILDNLWKPQRQENSRHHPREASAPALPATL